MNMRLKRLARSWVLPFFDPRRLASVGYLPVFFSELQQYRRLANGERVSLADAYPLLSDRLSSTPFDPHYFFQGAWLSRRLAQARGGRHVDVGSSVLMISVLSAHLPILFVDYRPLQVQLSGLESIRGDVTSLPFANGSLGSISCLHVIEHVGLGRYGDRLNPQGSQAAASELGRVLKPGGTLYVSVPVGRERVCFNAHRVFSPHTICSYLSALRLVQFSLVDDSGRFSEDTALDAARDLDYGCGMFEFTRDA